MKAIRDLLNKTYDPKGFDKRDTPSLGANFTIKDGLKKNNTKITLVGLLTALAFLGLFYFWLFFDTSVAVGTAGLRVHNLGLLSNRQNGMIACGFSVL